MAHQFIGLHMLVTLREPPARLKGTVSDIEAGISLTLSNVWLLDTGEWQPRLLIDASNVTELTEVPLEPQAQTRGLAPPNSVPQTISPAPQPVVQKQTSSAPFVDPAILSIGKRPQVLAKTGPVIVQNHAPESKAPQRAASGARQAEDEGEDLTPTGVTSEALKQLKLVSKPDSALHGQSGGKSSQPVTVSGPTTEVVAPPTGPRKRRARRRGKEPSGADPVQDEVALDALTENRGKGWRQTPMLQSSESFQPFKSLKAGGRGRRALQGDNGWASEDATDVQEAGDFDFEGSLAKFDKSGLFDQMRKDDRTDDADRLVSHNRQAQPKSGPAGGRNLHHSENVLEIPTPTTRQARDAVSDNFWNSEADDGLRNGAERLSGRDQGSRQSSRRGESKATTTRRSQSRKASTVASNLGPARVNSGFQGHATSSGLFVQPLDRKVETVSALQMLNLENIAHNELGLTDEMMTENAGRGIAEVAIIALNDPAVKIRIAGKADAPPASVLPHTIVVLAGNNKSGARAIAAGRHLRNKGITVLVCVVGMDRGVDGGLLEEMRQQVRIFKNLGGRIFNKSELFEHLRKASIPTLTIDAPRSTLGQLANPAPVTLIIDALLGLAVSFEELRTSDQASAYELIEWANRNEAFVLAVDVPTGIDPSTGKIAIIDGGRLYVKPRYVVSVAAPKRGLLEALISSDATGTDEVTAADPAGADESAAEWKLFVVDVGFGPSVWKKAGTKIRKGIEFGDRWVCEMKYRGSSGAGEEQ